MTLKARMYYAGLVLTCVVWMLMTSVVQANSSINSASLKQSLDLIESLLYHSSVAKKVESVESDEARRYLDQARQQHQLALISLEQGNHKRAKSQRDESLRLLTQAGRLANQAEGDPEKQLALEFQVRIQAVDVLLVAHKRIAEEKSILTEEQKFYNQISANLNEAKRLAQAKNYDQAITSVNEAYYSVTSSIEKMRTGETLVRSLDFATEKEEYEYEYGRYKNYQMLVNLVVEERKMVRVSSDLKRLLDEARGYEQKAQQLAQVGDYSQAISTIDKASKSLVTFIRSSGVYIPG